MDLFIGSEAKVGTETAVTVVTKQDNARLLGSRV